MRLVKPKYVRWVNRELLNEMSGKEKVTSPQINLSLWIEILKGSRWHEEEMVKIRDKVYESLILSAKDSKVGTELLRIEQNFDEELYTLQEIFFLQPLGDQPDILEFDTHIFPNLE